MSLKWLSRTFLNFTNRIGKVPIGTRVIFVWQIYVFFESSLQGPLGFSATLMSTKATVLCWISKQFTAECCWISIRSSLNGNHFKSKLNSFMRYAFMTSILKIGNYKQHQRVSRTFLCWKLWGNLDYQRLQLMQIWNFYGRHLEHYKDGI